MIHLAFRLDDPSLTSNHALERELFARFGNSRTPLTCAVVPFLCTAKGQRALTAEAVPHLLDARNQGTIELALHGYCHRELSRLANGNSTEFSGIHPRRQREALTHGKVQIEEVFSVPVTGFVPPWNSYDRATLGLLAELGFGYVSADWALVSEDTPPIAVIPHTCNLVHLKDAVSEARQFVGLNPAVVVILHHFDFVESGNDHGGTDLAGLERLLAWVGEQSDLTCTTLQGIASRMAPERCAQNLRLARRRSGFHWRLQRLLPHYVLLDADSSRLFSAVGTRALMRLPRALAA
jgi:hypothetical protein